MDMSDEAWMGRPGMRGAGVAASAASQPHSVEQQLIRQASKDNRRRELEKTACFGHLVQNGAFGAVRFYFRSHVTLYRVDLCDYRVIPVTMPHPRKLEKMVRFGASTFALYSELSGPGVGLLAY